MIKILILDYSVDRSETYLIKRCLPANSDVSSLFIDTEESFSDNLINDDFTHVIHTGSSFSITKITPFTDKAVEYIKKARDKGVRQMGICYGHQLICRALVGKQAVRASPNSLEAGWNSIKFLNSSISIFGVKENEVVWQHHFDEVTELPDGSELLATNEHTRIQAYINYKQRLFGMQFHPEFDKEAGDKIFLDKKSLLLGPSFEVGKVFFDFFLGMKV